MGKGEIVPVTAEKKNQVNSTAELLSFFAVKSAANILQVVFLSISCVPSNLVEITFLVALSTVIFSQWHVFLQEKQVNTITLQSNTIIFFMLNVVF